MRLLEKLTIRYHLNEEAEMQFSLDIFQTTNLHLYDFKYS